MSVIGVPIKVLHEAEGHIVTVETTTGEVRDSVKSVLILFKTILFCEYPLKLLKIS